jgi:hypothetical protein
VAGGRKEFEEHATFHSPAPIFFTTKRSSGYDQPSERNSNRSELDEENMIIRVLGLSLMVFV